MEALLGLEVSLSSARIIKPPFHILQDTAPLVSVWVEKDEKSDCVRTLIRLLQALKFLLECPEYVIIKCMTIGKEAGLSQVYLPNSNSPFQRTAPHIHATVGLVMGVKVMDGGLLKIGGIQLSGDKPPRHRYNPAALWHRKIGAFMGSRTCEGAVFVWRY